MTTHPQVPAVMPRVQYLADGGTAAFAFPFPIFAQADLRVFLNAAPQDGGFTVSGAGQTEGGSVTFASPPAAGTVVTLERRLSVERLSDFGESGPLSARALNEQLDRMTAMVQEARAEQERVVRAPATDLAATLELPSRAARAGKVLGFDEVGAPVALPPGSGADPAFTAQGAGAVGRGMAAKLRDLASAKDFGAVGDGIADDTDAIRAALAAHRAVFLPAGTYRTTGTITLGHGQTLYGVGEGSVIQARATAFDPVNLPSYPSGFNAVELVDGYATLRDLRIVGGAAGVKLYGRDGPCVKNVLENLSLWDNVIGLVLDGYQDPDRPCYWNHITRVLVARPQLHGVLLTVEGAGDTPNANKFVDVRVYSLAAPLSGCGFFLSAGRFNNSFTDCEANLHPNGEACFRLGAATDQTLVVNFYAESLGALPGIRIDNGSQGTSIVNLFSATGGQPIWDTTGARKYTAVNAGFPLRNLLKETLVTDLRVEGFSLDTEYVEPAAGGVVTPDLTSTTYFVSAFGGAVEFRLPQASTANGRVVTVKKTDGSANPVRVTEGGGPGPDGRTLLLASRFDGATLVSNGAGWWVTAHNMPPVNAEFWETAGLFTPDCAKALYLVSASAGAVEVRLPAPSDPQAVGRTVTIKKADLSDTAVTVTQAGGGTGPEGRAWVLSSRYDYLTVFSNGAAWLVLGGRTQPLAVRFREAAGLFQPDLGAELYLVSAFAGPVEVRLPAPADGNVGRRVSIKKTDASANAVTVTSGDGSTGPDGATLALSAKNAAVTAISNGAAWHVVARV
ncbi:hypothetical protein HHL28_17170 [Aerophototrophica crusticola]|uniref:Rhamnogalacturonase A/B/Epimerase-like pectate lyase domain-containing protein n=1 Tax=Aerophototrophica crusticola TaxID=1709002 RepID=A0A858RBU9_9PROT|nr:hypothetical protein HHL28_17170 [Rhodospirillaceae bacterium B3]